MIAGVVATLTHDAKQLGATLGEFSLRTELELGEFAADARRIPMTIDSASRTDIEVVTDWIRSRTGVAFVDVAFVHFEESDDVPVSTEAPGSASKELSRQDRNA